MLQNSSSRQIEVYFDWRAITSWQSKDQLVSHSYDKQCWTSSSRLKTIVTLLIDSFLGRTTTMCLNSSNIFLALLYPSVTHSGTLVLFFLFSCCICLSCCVYLWNTLLMRRPKEQEREILKLDRSVVFQMGKLRSPFISSLDIDVNTTCRMSSFVIKWSADGLSFCFSDSICIEREDDERRKRNVFRRVERKKRESKVLLPATKRHEKYFVVRTFLGILSNRTPARTGILTMTMILPVALLINNIGLFVVEVIGYHACHSGRYSPRRKPIVCLSSQ